ncbi:MAG: siroheme synthase [Caulobacter sp.]|nr:siroheme synthase [Caulobacter sp.]
MESFPAFFPLAGRIVVIVGAGEAADNKARLFDGSPATLLRLDGEPALRSETYAGAALVFIGGGDAAFVRAAAEAARHAGVPVNVVDRPELCDFTTPAVIDRGGVVAAVGTGGAAPILATLLRNDIEARVPEGAGRLAALLQRFQCELRAALPVLHLRRAFLRQAVTGAAGQAALAGDMAAAETLFREALAGGWTPAGRVQLVAGDGPADLLSLRAVRALAAADILVVDADVDPAIVDLARRDAERLDPEAATPQHLAALAAEGRQVVWVAAPLTSDAVQALETAGAPVDVLRAAQP